MLSPYNFYGETDKPTLLMGVGVSRVTKKGIGGRDGLIPYLYIGRAEKSAS